MDIATIAACREIVRLSLWPSGGKRIVGPMGQAVRNYKLYLHHNAHDVPDAIELIADCDEDAVKLATVVANACGDVCTSFELWETQRLLISGDILGFAPTAAQLDGRLQKIVLDRELALRDSNGQLSESRSLLKSIDTLFAHIDMGFGHT
jgi:hypothetical protein